METTPWPYPIVRLKPGKEALLSKGHAQTNHCVAITATITADARTALLRRRVRNRLPPSYGRQDSLIGPDHTSPGATSGCHLPRQVLFHKPLPDDLRICTTHWLRDAGPLT